MKKLLQTPFDIEGRRLLAYFDNNRLPILMAEEGDGIGKQERPKGGLKDEGIEIAIKHFD